MGDSTYMYGNILIHLVKIKLKYQAFNTESMNFKFYIPNTLHLSTLIRIGGECDRANEYFVIRIRSG